jgi:hypothetical protein
LDQRDIYWSQGDSDFWEARAEVKKILCFFGIHFWENYYMGSDGNAAVYKDRCAICYLSRTYWIGDV